MTVGSEPQDDAIDLQGGQWAWAAGSFVITPVLTHTISLAGAQTDQRSIEGVPLAGSLGRMIFDNNQ